MSLRASQFALSMLCLCSGPVTSSADELRPALLELKETGNETYDVLWKTPVRNGLPLALQPQLPADCWATGETREFLHKAARIQLWQIHCPQGLAGETISFDGLAAISTDVLARIEHSDGALQLQRASFTSPTLIVSGAPESAAVARTYFVFGVTHILGGVDHLLFVLALILLIPDSRRLIAAVTAFTVAHSITLAVSTLGIFRPPQQPIEAVIALSILFLAVELVRKRHGEASIGQRFPWIVAFAFGLLHGFGFASALLAAGLPSGDIPAALLFFNLGVEAGQLGFIAVTLVVFAGLRATSLSGQGWLSRCPEYVIGVVAAFWTIERTLGFWP